MAWWSRPTYSTPTMTPTEQRHWEAKGRELRDDQLKRVRDAAARWAGTIGTLTSVGSIVTLLTARAEIGKLDPAAQTAVALLLGLALLLALVAVYRAARASLGTLRPSPLDPETVRQTAQDEPQLAANAIRQSQLAVGIAVASIAAAIYLTWGGAVNAPVAQPYLFTPATPGAVYCGVLASDDEGRLVLLATPGGARVGVHDAAKLVKIDRCPGAAR